ncbi:MAG: TIGR01244 family sulfur transferase [Burkholderiales bacterium]
MSIQLTRHTPDFATSPQVMVEDIKEVAALGFKTLINNRPDGESAGQPTNAQLEEAAGVFGLHYIFLPVVRSQVGGEADKFGKLLAAAPKPALAFCRSGTRSIMLYQTANSLKANR